MLRAAPLLGVGLLLVNDHVIKVFWPGWLSGKLSDFAGLLFFPLLLQAFAEVLEYAASGSWVRRNRVLLGAGLVTAVVFAATNLSTHCGHAYAVVMGTLHWLAHCGASLGRDVPPLLLATHTTDPTDLLALPSVAFAVYVGWAGRAG